MLPPSPCHYPETEGLIFPLPADGLAPDPSDPTGGAAGTRYPSCTHLQRMDTTHLGSLATLSHHMENLARDVIWGLVVLHHSWAAERSSYPRSLVPAQSCRVRVRVSHSTA